MRHTSLTTPGYIFSSYESLIRLSHIRQHRVQKLATAKFLYTPFKKLIPLIVMDYTNLSLNELNDKVDMVEIAVAIGYQEDKSKSWRGGRCFVLGTKDTPEDRIFIQPSRSKPGMQHFSSTEFDTGGNGSAMLVKHALEHNFVADPLGASNDPRSFDINRKVAKFMCNHLSIPDEERQQLISQIPVLKRGEPFDEKLAKSILAPAVNSSLFGRRGISRDTFESPTFKGTWFNANKEVDTRRKDSDLCFPCYRSDNSLGGLNFRYYSQSRSGFSALLMTNSEHANTIWHSNIPEKIDRIFIAESEFDCMAHYQLNKEKSANTLYISHQGFLIPSQVDCIIDLMRENKKKLTPDFKLLLGSDNDTQGTRYDLQIIKSIAELKKSTLQLDLNGKSDNVDLIVGEKNNEQNIQTTITVCSEKYEQFKKLTNEYLNENNTPNITVRFADDINSVKIIRPNSDRFANVAVSELILNSDLLIRNVRREKAVDKDWNDDLKMLNKINSTLWNDNHFNDLGLPKKMDYQTYRALAQENNFHFTYGKDFKQFINSIAEKIPNDPALVEKKNKEDEEQRLYEEKYRQAQAETKAKRPKI